MWRNHIYQLVSVCVVYFVIRPFASVGRAVMRVVHPGDTIANLAQVTVWAKRAMLAQESIHQM